MAYKQTYARNELCVKCGHALSDDCKQDYHPACNNRSQVCRFTDPVTQLTAHRKSDGYLPCPRCKKDFVRPSELTVCVFT